MFELMEELATLLRKRRHKRGAVDFIHTLIQGTDTIGQFMRQHGNDPVDQIYAGATFQSFPVQTIPE